MVRITKRIDIASLSTCNMTAVCSPVQWCGVTHEMMQFVSCVLAVFLCDCLSNTCSQLAVDLQLMGEGGNRWVRVHYSHTCMHTQTHTHTSADTDSLSLTHAHTNDGTKDGKVHISYNVYMLPSPHSLTHQGRRKRCS